MDGNQGEAPQGLRLVPTNQAAQASDWIWNSPQAVEVRVGHLRKCAAALQVSRGFARLQRALLYVIDQDHYYVARRSRTTMDKEWFKHALGRLLGGDPGPRTGSGAREEWTALLAVMLGHMASGERHRLYQDKLSASLRITLDSGDSERISRWIVNVSEKNLAEMAVDGYVWLPTLIAQMATAGKALGANDEGLPSYSSWRSGSHIPHEVVSLAGRWHKDQFDFDATGEDDETEIFDLYGRLCLVKSNLSSAAVRRLMDCEREDGEDELVAGFAAFRCVNTDRHAAEIVELTSERLGVLACAAVEITWEAQEHEGQGRSRARSELFPGKSEARQVQAWHRLRINVASTLADGESSDAYELHMRLLGWGLGKQLGEWVHEEMCMRVEPGSMIPVHVTPMPGRCGWEQLLRCVKMGAEGLNMEEEVMSPEESLVTVQATRAELGSEDMCYPALGRVDVPRKYVEKWNAMRHAAWIIAGYCQIGTPLALVLGDDGPVLYKGWCNLDEEIELGDSDVSEGMRESLSSAFALLRSKDAKRVYTSIARQLHEDVDSFVLVFFWGLGESIECLFKQWVWEDPDSWGDLHEEEDDGEKICHAVMVHGEEKSSLQLGRRVPESDLERFWGHFPSELTETIESILSLR